MAYRPCRRVATLRILSMQIEQSAGGQKARREEPLADMYLGVIFTRLPMLPSDTLGKIPLSTLSRPSFTAW